ncbi:hypothetical protein [Bdellovibrio reynosensis]|uniref:Lipoprotein n=1 Tax=Bdellovibrio reynosensis TaxID=2835041 RepID=A0ABY4C9C8_9BACT|nr:hypothetical protein [Bdellovibrio reynosensis]UOF00236.1 hypothetical protein MNR06_11040 [Bdellovibrio reynosensis]
MQFKSTITFTLLALSLGACSNGGGGSPLTPIKPVATPTPATPAVPGTFEELSYTFTEANRCTTGTHKFNNKKDFCNALLDDARNQNCARNERSHAYSAQCSGTQPTRIETLPAYSAIRCVVNAMDLKDRSFFGKLNIFNPQRQQSFTDMPWNGRKSEEFGLMSLLGGQYGRSRFIATPARAEHSALGEVQLSQNKGIDSFSVRAGLGSQLRTVVTNHYTQKEVETVCLSDKSFRRKTAPSNLIRCSYHLGKIGENRRAQEFSVHWDGQANLRKEILSARSGESVMMTLKPGSLSQQSRIELHASDIDGEKTIVAESAIDEGLELRYRGHENKTDFFVICAPASK